MLHDPRHVLFDPDVSFYVCVLPAMRNSIDILQNCVFGKLHLFILRGSRPSRLYDDYNEDEGGDGVGDDSCDLGDRDYDDDNGDVHGG